MGKDYWKKWIKCSLVRAIKTIAQTAVAALSSYTILGEVDWLFVLSVTALAGVNSMLTSLAGIPEVPKDKEDKDNGIRYE